MLSLSDLGERRGTKEAVLRGRKVAVRGLSAAEVHIVLAVCAEPPPPMKPDPTKGSHPDAPKVPDAENPAWQAACRRARQRQRVMEVAIAVGWTTAAGSQWPGLSDLAAAVAYLPAAADEIEAGLSESELTALYRAVRETEEAAEKDALGN